MDGNVAAMSLQERGAYITLLCICWQEKSLPAAPRRLANIVGLPAAAFQRIWPNISGCFVQQGDRLLHPRLEKEREKQQRFSRRQSDAADARWHKPRASQSHAVALPEAMPPPCSPISDLRSPISGSPPERESLVPSDELWAQFQAAYPSHRREGGFLATQGFLAACDAIGFPLLMARLDRQKRSAQWKKGMVPQMGNYFQRELWRQEPDDVAVPRALGQRVLVPSDEPL